jgi:16S rRNA A1518/A1519 N6-dimethyltransferase RsmA/KsgA/DIM1 with predicted DNA glycosylase/AP lyase activity
VFLIQKEVADKIKTDAKKKSYLRRLLNNRYTIEYLFTVAPESFDPPPKIDSAVVQLKREKNEQLNNEKYVRMLDFLDLVSPYKRKTLGKIQKMLAKK